MENKMFSVDDILALVGNKTTEKEYKKLILSEAMKILEDAVVEEKKNPYLVYIITKFPWHLNYCQESGVILYMTLK